MLRKHRRVCLVLAIVISVGLAAYIGQTLPGKLRDTSERQDASSAFAGDANPVLLPAVFNRFPLVTVFGAAVHSSDPVGVSERMAGAGAHWVRGYGVNWSSVEPAKGGRYWDALASLEQELLNARSRGMEVILVVSGTPSWAQGPQGGYCGPISPGNLGAFASFMRDLVARYSVEPYGVRYWELWNEPDVDPTLVGPEQAADCWGDQGDPYYGGGCYGAMLKAVYPEVKAANPEAQVLVGGLLLDCDPRSPGACTGPHGSSPPKFLEGILSGGGGQYLDGVSFHAYDYYQGVPGWYGNPNWQSAWNTGGPVGTAKASYIRGLLEAHGVSGKYLMNTESALLCDGSGCDDAFQLAKAYYVAQAYAVAIADGLRANVWYSALGWRNSGLLASDLSALPAYTAYQHASSELLDAKFRQEIKSYPGLRAYEFVRSDRRVWVLWSLDGEDHAISLPGSPLAIRDALGVSMPVSPSLVVGLKPLYVEWSQ